MARQPGAGEARVELLGAPRQPENLPRLAIATIDETGEELHRSPVGEDGAFRLSAKALETAHEVHLVPADLPDGAVDRPAVRFHVEELRELLRAGEPLRLAPDVWERLRFGLQCVSGSVVACRLLPWHLRDLELGAIEPALDAFRQGGPPPVGLGRREAIAAADAMLAIRLLPTPIPPRCTPVCDGWVEVYRRTCCCEPWRLEDGRLAELIRRIEEELRRRIRPPIWRWPPPPPPPPWERADPATELVRAGVLDEPLLNAEHDVLQLRALSGRDLLDYVEQRPYLRRFWCNCGRSVKVASTLLRPDGSFQVCWLQPPFPFPIRANCHEEYAFVVKQRDGEQAITIYDGVAAGRWFTETGGIRLASYDWRARACRDDPYPDARGAFAVLERIGHTGSERLKSPRQTGRESVAAPFEYNDGLCDPAPQPGVEDVNWGGDLVLHYHFSEALRATGAVYYRVSVVRAGADGAPVAPTGDPRDDRHVFGERTPEDDLSLGYFERVEPFRQLSRRVGPHTVGGQPHLYEIPYRSIEDWFADQPSAIVRTTAFRDDRHLVTLELFDGNGAPLAPAGAGFEFRILHGLGQQMTPVPQEALTHLLWWDNRHAAARIEQPQIAGQGSEAPCQFLEAPEGSPFTVAYRAYHENPLFLLHHTLTWKRGLGAVPGSSGTLVPASPANAGHPPGPPATSPPVTIETLLGTETKCAFALNLTAAVKTTNGSGRLEHLDAYDQAALALERTHHPPHP